MYRMDRPRIGITTHFQDGAQSLNLNYVRAVETAGGLPLIIPMLTDRGAVEQLVALLDGLLITGGNGITKGLIGALPDDLPEVDPVRAAADALLYEVYTEKTANPLFGICYGMQFINAQAGGTIYADLMAQREGSHIHSAGRGGTIHPIRLDEGSRMRDLLGAEIAANTFHIQALADVGDGLRVVGTSPDGIIEAIESTDGRMMGVQFHPERMLDSMLPLFIDFVERCRKKR
jgi:putative glutamine amidotransferase